MSIAFFDFDRTLIAVNSASLWIRRELRLGFLSWWEAIRASAWLLRYELGFADLESVVRLVIGSLQGSSEDALKGRVGDFYAQQIRGLYRPRAREALESHRAKGDRLVLLTSASSYLAEAVARDLGIEDVLCNRFEVDPDGNYTGRPLGEICYGNGKLVLARRYAEARGIPLEACAFYTDSMADLPLLEVVGQPVAVNPDPRLRRLAAQRGWTITDWGTPVAGVGIGVS